METINSYLRQKVDASFLRKMIEEEPTNSDWFYLLFLNENGDYTNMNFDDIKGELDFNRALALASRLKRNYYEAEYNLYKNLNKELIPYFFYAQRGDFTNFKEALSNCKKSLISLSNRKASINDTLDNLEYLISIIRDNQILVLTFLALNTIYLLTKNKDILHYWFKLQDSVYRTNIEISTDLKLSIEEIIGEYASLKIQLVEPKTVSDDDIDAYFDPTYF